jgi:hypothetical protein
MHDEFIKERLGFLLEHIDAILEYFPRCRWSPDQRFFTAVGVFHQQPNK